MGEETKTKASFLAIISDKNSYNAVFNKVKDYEAKNKCDLALLSRRDYIQIFIDNDWISSTGTFNSRKVAIRAYLEWYFDGAEDKISKISSILYEDVINEADYSKFFFKDFIDLQNFILTTLEFAEEKKMRHYEMTVGIIYLIWLNITSDKIENINIDDFNYEKRYLQVGNRKINIINYEICDYFLKLKTQAIEKGFKKLIHSHEKNRDYSNNNFHQVVNNHLKRFYKLCGESKEFSYKKLLKSGFFMKFYALQVTNNYRNTDFDSVCKNELDTKVNSRDSQIYGAWKKWKEASSDDNLQREIERILEEMEKIRDNFLQEDYWSITKSRIGQSYFRDALIQNNSCKCVLCDIKTKEALVASHIKEFSECQDDERYDCFNGLLLCANHDKLFDKHLISFDENGYIMISRRLSKEKVKSFNLDPNICIQPQVIYNDSYMDFHRKKYKELNKD
jgi:hypothetical protein